MIPTIKRARWTRSSIKSHVKNHWKKFMGEAVEAVQAA